jgi:hypothetical protein
VINPGAKLRGESHLAVFKGRYFNLT